VSWCPVGILKDLTMQALWDPMWCYRI
jgi:hypothetical protein